MNKIVWTHKNVNKIFIRQRSVLRHCKDLLSKNIEKAIKDEGHMMDQGDIITAIREAGWIQHFSDNHRSTLSRMMQLWDEAGVAKNERSIQTDGQSTKNGL